MHRNEYINSGTYLNPPLLPIPDRPGTVAPEVLMISSLMKPSPAYFVLYGSKLGWSQKQRNKALTLAHAQTIHYTSN